MLFFLRYSCKLESDLKLHHVEYLKKRACNSGSKQVDMYSR
jgi:hypothetical protein